jgi:hypothetical protein
MTGYWHFKSLQRVTAPSNNGNYSPNNKVSCPRTPKSPATEVWEPQSQRNIGIITTSSTKQFTCGLLLRLNGALDCCKSLSLSLWPERTQRQSLLLPAWNGAWAHTLRQFICIQWTANQCLYLLVIWRNILEHETKNFLRQLHLKSLLPITMQNRSLSAM